MRVSTKSLVLTAAFTGLLGGTMTRLNAGVPNSGQSNAGQMLAQATPNPKHACAGKNACKGTGGCATDGSKNNKAKAAGVAEKHACAGKNSCKGNGGCATDGSNKKKG